MPPGPTAPRSLAGLLAEFRPCFTAPTFQTFIGLVVGLIAQTRRRTVCGMLTGAGLEQVWHHSRAHRLFTNARWSSDALGLGTSAVSVGPVRGRCAGCGAAPPRSRAPAASLPRGRCAPPWTCEPLRPLSGRADGQAGGLPVGCAAPPNLARAGGRR